MDNDAKGWLEQEYQEFERQFLGNGRFWRAPVHTLSGTPLFNIFETFTRLFPDHPSDVNTVFYLVESVHQVPMSQGVWLWCSHFEHSSLEDLHNLVSFMEEVSPVVSTAREVAVVEMLDAFRERLVLAFPFAHEHMAELLKARGLRGGAE